MDQWTALYAPLVGRILLGGFFIWSGIEKILNFDAFVGYLGMAQLPQPLYVALAIVSIETLAGIALVADVQTRFSALILAMYMLASSILFFEVTTVVQTQLFIENLALVGGLLILGGLGSSRWSPGWRA